MDGEIDGYIINKRILDIVSTAVIRQLQYELIFGKIKINVILSPGRREFIFKLASLN